MTPPLRIVTWLAPGIPVEFFELVRQHLADSLGRPTELICEGRDSGPMSAGEDAFAAGAADVGFLCSPSYLWLQRREPISVALVPAAPVPDDPRAAGRPVYFSEVVVRGEDPVERFEQLAGRRFCYNDESSLSGYFGLWKRVVDAGWDDSFFGELTCSGSHADSLDAILDGGADAAAIDSNVLRRWKAERPGTPIRTLESLGPFPIQPVVLRAELAELAEPIAKSLLSLTRAQLAPHGLLSFHPLDVAKYDEELELLQLPQRLPSGVRWLDRF